MAYALFDSKATCSHLHFDIAEVADVPEILRLPMEVATALEGDYLKIKALLADFYYNDTTLSDEFMVVSGLSAVVIICVSILKKCRTKIDIKHDSIIINPKVAKLILKNLR